MNDKDLAQNIAKGFEAALNRHGYSFQHRVLREAQIAAEKGRSKWMLDVQEFPVEVQGSGTRIDFILRYYGRSLYLLSECKRANPAISNWCFAKSSFVPDVELARGVFIETLHIDWTQFLNLKPIVSASTHYLAPSDFIYHIALEIKTDAKGEATGQGRSAIEEAATQVCRGLNGFLSFVRDRPETVQDESIIGFLPVIFTTARLWVSDVDLGTADLSSGNISLAQLGARERPWLFYHYHQSPGLKHSILPTKEHTALDDILYSEYVRTIAVVNAVSVEEFLGLSIWMA